MTASRPFDGLLEDVEQLVSLVMRYNRAATSTVAESAMGPPQGPMG